MRKATIIAGLVLVGISVVAVFLYSRFVGFEKPTLASYFPEDTLAFLEVRHIRKTAFAFSRDEQLQASVDVISAILKTITDASEDEAFPDTDVEIDVALLRDLGSHFKTRLALAAFAPENTDSAPNFVLSSYFYGTPSEFDSTLRDIAKQASTAEESYSITTQQAEGTTVSKLEITFQDPTTNDLTLAPCWTVFEDVFYLASDLDTLQQVVEFNRSQNKLNSFEGKLARHAIEDFLTEAPHLILALNRDPLERYLTDLSKKRINELGGLWLSVSPEILFSELGVSDVDSALVAMNFSDSQETYSSLRYTPKSPEDSPRNPDLLLNQVPESLLLYGSESVRLSPAALAENVKNAILKAAPLANFPYIALRSRVLSRTDLDFEEVITRSFGTHLVYLQSLDIGTVYDQFGRIREADIHDQAFKIQLNESEELKTLWAYCLDQIAASATFPIYAERSTTFFEISGDTSTTGGRLAVDLSDEYLTIGIGTLKTFNLLKDREEYLVPTDPSQLPSDREATQIGEGRLSLQALPKQLFQLANVFYLQMNPGREIPSEFYEFDWNALSALEHERVSKTYLSDEGHLFRISQIDSQ